MENIFYCEDDEFNKKFCDNIVCDYIKKSITFTTIVHNPDYYDGDIECECLFEDNIPTKMVWKCINCDDINITDFYKCVITFSSHDVIHCRMEDYEEIPLDDIIIHHENFRLISFDISDCELSKNQPLKNKYKTYKYFLENIEEIYDAILGILKYNKIIFK